MTWTVNSKDGFLKELKRVIEANLENPDFSISELCKEIGVSRSQLHRRVKSYTSLSTSLFIRRIRMLKAKELLQSTDLNISEIAYKTGNTSPQNFSKYFIEEFGISPSVFRKQVHRGNENKAEKLEATSKPISIETKEWKSEAEIAILPENQSKSKLNGWLLLFILILITGIFLIGNVIVKKMEGKEKPIPVESQSIAIIPFQNLSSAENNFFCEGVVEDILTHLTYFKNLRVISRTSSAKYKNTKKDIRQISSELNVAYLLEGSVRQYGHKVRITAQLIRAADDNHIWARNYDRDIQNVMEIQSEVAKEIAKSLNQNISPEIARKIDRIHTRNIDAYNALLHGKYLMRTRTFKGLKESIKQFDHALSLDPGFSEAFAGKASACNLLVNLRYITERKHQYLQMAEENVLFAIKEDSNNAQAYAIRGNIFRDQFKPSEAISSYRIALAMNPNDALTNYWFSLALRSTGQLDEAMLYHQKACELDPLHPLLQAGYIYTSIIAGKFELAEELLRRGEPLFNNSFLYHYVKGSFYMYREEFKKAIPHFDQSIALNEQFKSSKLGRIYCFGRLGYRAQVMSYIASLDLSNADEMLLAGLAYAGLREKDQAIKYIKKAAELGVIAGDMVVDKKFENLRDDPAYASILRDYGFDDFTDN